MDFKYSPRAEKLRALLKERIVFLDGGMGTLIQREGLSEADFRGDVPELLASEAELKGNNDILNITRPDIISKIHRAYYEAGADIVTTNTFASTPLIQKEYGLENMAVKFNAAAAKMCRKIADEFEAKDGRPRFVAGSIGPMNKSASIPPNPNDTASRNVTFDEIRDACYAQMKALYENGVDLFLCETNFDTLNVKAAIHAYLSLKEDINLDIPISISMTVSDLSGRTLSGQTIEAFYASIRHANPLFVGLNCALGADKMRPYVEAFSRIAECYTHCYPNAGLPNPLSEFGYDQLPEDTAKYLAPYAKEGLLNVIGGCCGTTPAHIAQIVKECSKFAPRQPKAKSRDFMLSGLEPLTLPEKDAPFTFVGERTNVMGSLAFKRMIKEGDFNSGLGVARKQVENGANAIDINFDEALLDGKSCMRTFLNMVAAEPEISRVPIMIDSSDWQTLLAGMKCVQGKGIVNSISLKEGEEAFLKKAKEIQKFGFAMIVMAFDENGQAATKSEKIRICKRSYDLLVEAGIEPENIVFDANVLTIATGIEEHDSYAVDFIEAVREIKRICPYARTSAGVSNVSFAFRGNNPVREAMHSVFLYHARNAGLDMGIVNAGMLVPYDEIEPRLKTLVEDVVLNKSHSASEALLEAADSYKNKDTTHQVQQDDFETLSWDEKMQRCFIKGLDDKIESTTAHFFEELKNPLAVIEGPLMSAMKKVGDLFGEGKMFLPQVVKSARVMKKAVAYLEPFMSKKGGGRGKIVIATVKGDVHDIGKNIVGSVLACNGYEVVDLGVMCPPEKIVEAAKDCDLVGLSALITPSLNEMAIVAKMFEAEGIHVPIVVGGASTSKMHTAVKLAPLYSGQIVRVEDASVMATTCAELINPDSASKLKLKAEQEALREKFEASRQEKVSQSVSFEEAQKRAFKCEFSKDLVAKPASFDLWLGSHSIDELEPYFSWSMFFSAWGILGSKKLLKSDETNPVKEFYIDALKVLDELKKVAKPKAVWRFFRANSDKESIEMFRGDNKLLGTLQFFRNQSPNQDGICACATDFVAPKSAGFLDCVGLFAATAGVEASEFVEKLKREGKEYESIIAATLCDMIAEAYAKYLNLMKWRPFSQCEGIRPACGYAMWADHSQKQEIWKLLNVEAKTGIKLTESFMMTPSSSVCGIWISNPQAKYINSMAVKQDQLESYAKIKGVSSELVRKSLSIEIVE